MPELPEVEITRRGIAPHILGEVVQRVIIRESRLRFPIAPELETGLVGQTIRAAKRRAKYLLLYTDVGCLILHLGMSGSLRALHANTAAQKHDHVDLVLGNGVCLRLRDPRRFGALLWTKEDPLMHPLLAELGPEPWDAAFDGRYLYRRAHGRIQAVKPFIMDGRTVVGVGNIYASEALFAAGIHPARPAGRIALKRCELLAESIRTVLEEAIRQGGTTLRDFVGADGSPGYFRTVLRVYDRAGEPCTNCRSTLRGCVLGQRTSFYCSRCQR